ncbi:hypothetical protein DQ239_00025 [Blastococcus sp. TF02-09]|nr:hypothetical protein DQ239_00025 [Blastococcus sp. TF02-9]
MRRGSPGPRRAPARRGRWRRSPSHPRGALRGATPGGPGCSGYRCARRDLFRLLDERHPEGCRRKGDRSAGLRR